MQEHLSIESFPDVEYRSPPVRVALSQVRFPAILSIKDEAAAGNFQNRIKATYPLLRKRQSVQIAIESGAEPQVQQEPFRWVFSDVSGGWSIVLATDFLALETHSYTSFQEFSQRYVEALTTCKQVFDPPLVTRLGLRYINEFRNLELPWTDAIRPELLGVVAAPEVGEMVRRSVGEAAFEFPDREFVTMRYGLLPRGLAVEPSLGEEIPDEPFFLLDYDAYTASAPPDALQFNVDHLATLLADYHSVIHRLFHWSVTPKYLSTLEVLNYDK